jgi:uncharacterized membrane protein YfcA
MWEQYRRTFVRMQIAIAMVSLAIYLVFGHLWIQAATFLLVMQIGAIIGAMWGVRLKHMIDSRSARLPLQSRR